jgi:hypothetical protein
VVSTDPVISVTVELGGDLARLQLSDADKLRRSVRSHLNGLRRAAGLPGVPAVRVDGDASSGRVLRVRVHDRVVPYPFVLLRRAWVHVLRARPPVPWDTHEDEHSFSDSWVARTLDTLEAREHRVPRPFVEFLAQAAVEIVRRRPSALVGPAETDAYTKGQLPADLRDRAQRVLGSLLDLGVALRDREAILDAIARSASTNEAIETALAELKGPRIEIQAEPGYLQRMLGLGAPVPAAGIPESSDQLPAHLVDLCGLLHALVRREQGVALPELAWVPEERIPADSVAIRINDRRGGPSPVVRPNEVVVGLGPDDLPQGVPGRALTHVVDVERMSAVPAELAGRLPAGETTWTPAEFALLVAVNDIRERLDCLVDGGDTLPPHPRAHHVRRRLVDVVLSRYPVVEIARIRRELVREHLPVNDLRLVLERLVQSGSAELTEHVRQGYADRFESRLNPDFGKPPEVYRLAPRLCAEIASGTLDDEEAERRRDLVWSEVGSGQPSGREVWFVAESTTRAAVRGFLATELPRARVVSTDELPAGVETRRIGPLARS